MSKHGLKELKELSLPAVGHPELVRLARTCSPSQTLKLARVAKWPKRQAEAARYLALLRRDHPGKVFDDSLLSMGQARTTDVVTERNQENDMTETPKMTDRLRRALALITDPQKKFELLLEHGLNREVETYLHKMIETGTVTLTFDHHERSLCQEAAERIGSGDPTIYTKGKIAILAYPESDKKSDALVHACPGTVAFHSLGLIVTLGWTAEKTTEVIRMIIEKSIQFPGSYWQVLGVTVATRLWLKPDEQVACQAELWQLLWHFRKGEIGDSWRWFFPPRYWERPSQSPQEDGNGEFLSMANRIVDRFLELGWDMDQIRQEFLAWLRNEDHIGLWPTVVYGIAAAKCFRESDEERYQALRPYLIRCWDGLEKGYKNAITLQSFLKLGKVGLFRVAGRSYYVDGVHKECQDGDEGFFRQRLTELLANGRVAWVYQLLRLAGSHLMSTAGVSDRDREQWPAKMMAELAPQAFALAVQRQRYGIAVALAQYFDCVAEAITREAIHQELRPELEVLLGRNYVDPDRWGEVLDRGLIAGGYITEPSEADRALDAKVVDIKERRDQTLRERIAGRRQQIAETLELVVDLKQPIRLEFAEYLTLG